MLAKMKLKKGDIILSIEKQAVSNKKQIYKILSALLKQRKTLSIIILRESKELSLSYQIQPYKNKKKLILAKVEKTSRSDEEKKKKRTLVPEKYKPYMQRAYVSSLNSFVYKQPNFDSVKLYPLSIGKHILISKKIFRPPHNFGTFYKVFLFKDRKVVGYISEAEVIAEFKREGSGFKANSSYKLAKKHILENKILNLDSIKEIKESSEKPKRLKQAKPAGYRQKYVGLSTGFLSSYIGAGVPREDWFIGLKLSGYQLLISYLNMDINFTSSLNWRKFYLDILTAYPILSSSYYHLFAMGGVMGSLNLDKDYKMNQESVDYGLAGALSLLAPLNKNTALKLTGKTVYKIRKRSFFFSCSAGLQVAF